MQWCQRSIYNIDTGKSNSDSVQTPELLYEFYFYSSLYGLFSDFSLDLMLSLA